jgi:hypothetical protein
MATRFQGIRRNYLNKTWSISANYLALKQRQEKLNLHFEYFEFVCADVAGWTLRPGDAALVGGRAGGIVTYIDGRRTGQEGVGLGGATVVGQRAQVGWALADNIAVAAVGQTAGIGIVGDALRQVVEPVLMLLNCETVLTEAGHAARAVEVLTQAKNWMDTIASRNDDEAFRHAYLHNVPAHRRLRERLQEFPLIDEMKPDELVRIQMASYLIAVDFQISMSSKRFSGARFAPLSPADEHHA